MKSKTHHCVGGEVRGKGFFFWCVCVWGGGVTHKKSEVQICKIRTNLDRVIKPKELWRFFNFFRKRTKEETNQRVTDTKGGNEGKIITWMPGLRSWI